MSILINLPVICTVLFIFPSSFTADDEEEVQDEDRVFQTRPVNVLVEAELGAAQFECSLREHGVLIWLYGPEGDMQQVAKGGDIRIERLKRFLSLVVLDTAVEKLKIERVTMAHSGTYHCRDAIKRVQMSAKLCVFETPRCHKNGSDLICELRHSISVRSSEELTCDDSVIPKIRNVQNEASTNIVEKDMGLVKATIRWNGVNNSDCELQIVIEGEETEKHFVFTSTKVTSTSLNISSGYTLLVGETVECSSTAGFLSNYRIIITKQGRIHLETTNNTFHISEVGTYNITCRAEGVLGGVEEDIANDIKVNTTVTTVPCELSGAVNCFNSYTSLIDGEREITIADVNNLCDNDRTESCLNYMKPCIMTRKVRGLQQGLFFLCTNLDHEYINAMLNNSYKSECLKFNFHILPLKDVYLEMMRKIKIPVTPIDVIYKEGAKYLQDAMKEACIRSHIAMSVNKTIVEWIFTYRELYFSNELRTFSEYIDEKRRLIDTSKCNLSSTAGAKNIACITAKKCIKILVGMAQLVHYGVVIVSNLTQFASDTCDGSLSQLQECSYALMDYYEDQSVYLAVNHLVVLFDSICERYWMSYVKHSECLLQNLESLNFLAFDDCVREMRSDLSHFPLFNETFLGYENQTTLCIKVHNFLGCQEKIISKMCGLELAILQRKFSRRGISMDMQNMYCYNTFSY